MRVKKKRKFQKGGGSSQTPLEWKFRVDGGLKRKNLPVGGYGYFLELHITSLYFCKYLI